MQVVEEWLGFYTANRLFWAGDGLDVNAPEIQQTFTDSMSAITYSFNESGVAVNICKDGMILMRVDELEQRIRDNRGIPSIESRTDATLWNEYLNLANVFYLLFDGSLVEVGRLHHHNFLEITKRDVFRFTYVDGRIADQSVPNETFSAQFVKDRYLSTEQITDTSLPHRQTVDEPVFQHCFERFVQLVGKEQQVVRLSDIAKSFSEYKVSNYPISLVTAWFVCEREISDRWEAFLAARAETYDDGRERINRERKTFLTGRDFTASVMSNTLELMDVITNEELRTLDKIRRARNSIAHNIGGDECDAAICQTAISIALQLVLEQEPFELQLNFGHTTLGI